MLFEILKIQLLLEGEVVRLSFQEYPFAIHADKGRCLLDYVTLFDGKENSARSKIPVNGRYRICGRRAPKSAIFSTGRFMTVRFYSAPRAHYTINTINESFVLETMSHKYSIYKGFNASLTAVRASGNVIETSQYDLNQASNENDDYISEYNIDPGLQKLNGQKKIFNIVSINRFQEAGPWLTAVSKNVKF